MVNEWAIDEPTGAVIGTVDGRHYWIVRHAHGNEFSFGEWGTSCNWHLREPDAPATLDGFSQLDPVPDPVVLNGSLPAGAARGETVQGADRTPVVLLSTTGSARPGWVGFGRLEPPAEHLEWFDAGGDLLGRLPLVGHADALR